MGKEAWESNVSRLDRVVCVKVLPEQDANQLIGYVPSEQPSARVETNR